MATFSDKVRITLEVVADKAKAGVKDFRDSVDDAETKTGKFKAGIGSLKDSLVSAASSPLGLAAGVGSVVAVAGKAITAFQDATLEVGKFRDATGTTSEEASRFVEVFNDLGVGSEAGAAAIGKMEKALGQNADAFKQYGVEVVRAKDGTIDAQGTFIAAVDALNKIKDPAEKAAAGAAIFGKGWQSMAEVIASGAPALKNALESVQPSKVFSDRDIQSGRNVRDAFDSIKDAGEGLLLTIGKSLAPAIAKFAPVIGDVISKAEPAFAALGDAVATTAEDLAPLIGLVGDLISQLVTLSTTKVDVAPGVATSIEDINDKAKGLVETTLGIDKMKRVYSELNDVQLEGTLATGAANAANGELTAGLVEQEARQAAVNAESARWTGLAAQYTSATEGAAEAQRDMEAAGKAVTRALDTQKAAWDRLKGTISDDQAWLDVQDAFDDVKAKGAEAFEAVKNKTADAESKMRDYQSSVNDAKSRVIDLGEQLGLSIPEVKAMLLKIDDGQIDDVEAQLANLTRNRTVIVNIEQRGGVNNGSGSRGDNTKRAVGGPVTAGVPYTVGELGPETFVPDTNGQILTAVKTAALNRAGGNTYVTNNYNVRVPAGTDAGVAIATANRLFYKRGGGR